MKKRIKKYSIARVLKYTYGKCSRHEKIIKNAVNLSNKFESVDEMGKFLGKYNLKKWIQGEVESPNSLIIIKQWVSSLQFSHKDDFKLKWLSQEILPTT